jgi:predicted ArsR family transcriptional regulator
MTKAHKKARLVLAALRTHGPLTDEQLCWWLSHFGVKESTARRLRWKLVEEGLVRFAKRFRQSKAGRWSQVWEVA